MQDSAPTFLRMLAPDGIVQVTFAAMLNGSQSIALLKATQTAKTVDELEKAIKDLGNAWEIDTETEIDSRIKQVTVMASHPVE